MRIRTFLISLLIMLLAAVPLSAQRQSQGRSSVDAAFVMDFTDGVRPSGGQIAWSTYGYDHHLSFGLDVLYRDNKYTEPSVYDVADPSVVIIPGEEHVFPSYELTFLYGYKYRIWSTRNRSLILSAGIWGCTGIQYCKEMSQYTKPMEKASDQYTNYGEAGFVQGVMPEVLFEAFPFRSTSFYLTVRPKAYIVNGLGGDKRPWLRFFIGFGTKFYL